MTYWGYGILGGALSGIPLAFVTPGSAPAIVAAFLCVGYALLVSVSIWRAAGKYQGPKIWSVLARVAVTLPVAGIAIAIIVPVMFADNVNGTRKQNAGLKTPTVAQVAGECKRSMDNIKEIRAKRPEWANLSDDSVVNVVRNLYYPDITKEQMAWEMCVELTPSIQPAKLGLIDNWRYASCQKEAAQAPTSQGVNVGLRLCKDQFGQ